MPLAVRHPKVAGTTAFRLQVCDLVRFPLGTPVAMAANVSTVLMRFDRGTLRVQGLPPTYQPIPGMLWDESSGVWRTPAYKHREVLSLLRSQGHDIDSELERAQAVRTGPWRTPELRPYQQDAIEAWNAFGRRGMVVLPTGAGKTRVAIAALAARQTTSLVLCPTRALLAQWQQELESWYGGPIGVVGDGNYTVEKVSVITFESAWRHADRLGDRFSLVVVDEAHHLGTGSRSELLEMMPAPFRLGLTATAPEPGTPADQRLCELLGPIVCELGVSDLVGTYLANYRRVRLGVRLDQKERNAYEENYGPFVEWRRLWLRENPGTDYAEFLRWLARTSEGRKVLTGYQRAIAIASLPRAKRVLTSRLLARHRQAKSLVFTALADHAYALSEDNLIPVITAEIGRSERAEILKRFACGRLRSVVSARVLNEGIDVPEASVAIVVAGSLGRREHIQRIGRVLRPRPGKTAVIYELVTTGTLDDERARARWKPAFA